MDCALARHGRRRAGPRDPIVRLYHALALAAGGAAVVLCAHGAHWHPLALAITTAFAVASELASVRADSRGIRISGTGLAIVLAATCMGAVPAAAIGAVSVTVGWLRSREAGHYFVNNLVTFTWIGLAGGLFAAGAHAVTNTHHADLVYYLLVCPTFLVTIALNFLLAAGYQCHLDGSSLRHKVTEALLPVMSAEMFSALLTMAAVYVFIHLGAAGVALIGILLGVFQYLIAELLTSNRRGHELARLVSHDTLTGLFNRDRFHEELAAVVARAGETSLGVMVIDLDRFKEINDTLGHHYGDEVLRDLGPRLAAAAGSAGIVARLGGDEFGLLTHDVEGAERLAAAIIACVQEAVYVDGLALEVGASIGIARYPTDARDAHELLRYADVAMYAAKEAHCGWRTYASELNHHSVRKLSVLSDFRRALDHGEITAYYQPVVDLADGTVRGAEALVRWEHPELGLLAPGAFIDTVERSGLIGPMTLQVLEQAVAQCAAWRAEGYDLTMAANLSVRNLVDRRLPADVDRLLSQYGLPPHAMALEITESMLMSDPERAQTTLALLNELGVRLSIDDFGTGYSSLATLRTMPIDELKIDRSFVSPMLRDESDLIIVRSTIHLGHDLGLRVIAEGVEDEPTLRRLARLGSDLAQGYHISRPMPAAQFERWLREPAHQLSGPAPVAPRPAHARAA